MNNRYNLIDEAWIPVADHGRASLQAIFSNNEYRSIGGNPVQKIALMKLLLAIAQSAVTPRDDQEWEQLGPGGTARQCLAYLDQWRDYFFLYGDRPFLQFRAIESAEVQEYGAVLPEVSSGNTTVLSQIQVQRSLEDAEKAVLLVQLMGFALGGKKTDNSVVLTKGYQGKQNDKGRPSSGRIGPSLGFLGLLHSFLIGNSLQKSLWLNLLTHEQIKQLEMFPSGIGIPPWEQMPTGEDCPRAREFKKSLMGRLIPLCRFCLLTPEGLHYSEGLAHDGYKEGVADPSTAINYGGRDPKALWVDPGKRSWRELTSLLSFIKQDASRGFQCWQIRNGLDRARDKTSIFALWSGGLRVSSNAGEQYVSGNDDFVESQVWLPSEILGELWFDQLKAEMDALEQLAKVLYGVIMAFYKEQQMDGSKHAAQASHLFWQYCERNCQELVDSCDQDEKSIEMRQQLRKKFSGYQLRTYDLYCPKETARQLDAWAKCKPNNYKYLNQEK